jgi:hypothetical protein
VQELAGVGVMHSRPGCVCSAVCRQSEVQHTACATQIVLCLSWSAQVWSKRSLQISLA